ncbi:MAG: serine hydrolase [Patescibacteria group bacterium]
MSIRSGVIFAGIFLVGIVFGFFSEDFFVQKKIENSKQVRQIGQYTYINPLLECEVAEGSIDARKENFRNELEKYVAKIKKERNLSEVAVYFRDLNNGPTFGVDIAGEFFPASLLKVPVMMAYYHLAEQDPSILQKEILFESKEDFGIVPTIVPKEELILGNTYTVEELIRRMIVYSDNQAIGLLTKMLPLTVMEDLFSMLGVGEDVLTDPEGKLTVKEYAGFFRILFNSSYLSREYSEKALALLAMTDYRDALPAGVSDKITVAHKFGEAGTENVERQLHDCGIVYFPDHPYLVCIMTRGKDSETLKKSIVDISKFLYDKIDKQY